MKAAGTPPAFPLGTGGSPPGGEALFFASPGSPGHRPCSSSSFWPPLEGKREKDGLSSNPQDRSYLVAGGWGKGGTDLRSSSPASACHHSCGNAALQEAASQGLGARGQEGAHLGSGSICGSAWISLEPCMRVGWASHTLKNAI